MSASAPRQEGMRNPAVKYISWKGGDDMGYFSYYDKTIEDPKLRNVKIDLSKGFFILDKDLFSITGYDEPNKSNIISNEVRELTDRLVIKAYKDKKATILHTGSYTELKDVVKNSNILHYTRSVYILVKSELGQWELCHIAMSGSAFKSWIEDVENNSSHADSLICHSSTEEGKKGIVKYKFPRFTLERKATVEEWDKVVEVDRDILQPYLDQYLKKNKVGTPSTHEDEQEAKAFDINNWREFKVPTTGTKLCDLDFDTLRQISDKLAEDGEFESDLFNCVSQAQIDWSKAHKEWKDKKNQAGKKLEDFTAEELKETISKVPTSNKYYIYLACALEEKTKAEHVEVEVMGDEDIPF